MKPGATINSAALKSSAPGALRFVAICTMRPPSRSTSRVASVPLAGSITRPFLISSICSFLGGVRRIGWCASHEVVEQGHADGQPVGHLFEHAGLRAVGDG